MEGLRDGLAETDTQFLSKHSLFKKPDGYIGLFCFHTFGTDFFIIEQS